MAMGRLLGAILAGLMMVGYGSAATAAQHTRIRGEISSAHGNALVIKTYSGKTMDLRLDRHTRYVLVVPASLSNITSNEFVGIGATGPEAHLLALEVVIFPNSMRGTGEGHYAWSVPATVADADRHHNAAGSATAPPVQGTMTNGTVASVGAAQSAPPVQGTMTNGTVAHAAGTAGGKELTITYNNGKKVQILVPADAPVVRLQPAHRSVLKQGAKAFAVATGPTGKLTANVVAVGKNGMMPPM